MHGPADNVVEFDRLAGELEAPVGFSALRLEVSTLFFCQRERGAVVDWRLVLGELALAAAVEFIRGFVARVEATGRA